MNTRYLTLLAVGAGALCLAARAAEPASNPLPGDAFPLGASNAAPAAQPAPTAAQTVPTLPSAALTTPPIAPSTSNVSAGQTATAPVVADPVPGDSVAKVYLALGKPNGVIDMPDKTIMMFDRGNVVVAQGTVMEVKLLPLPSYNARLAEQAATEAEREATRSRMNALRDLLLNDPSYLALSTRDRLLALQRFDHEHPGSDVHQDYTDLLSVYAAEEAAQAQVRDYQSQTSQAKAQASSAEQQKLAMQKQLAAAQQQATLAQQQATAAQQQAVNALNSSAPTGKAGVGGVVITGGGVPMRNPYAPVYNNGNNPPVAPAN